LRRRDVALHAARIEIVVQPHEQQGRIDIVGQRLRAARHPPGQPVEGLEQALDPVVPPIGGDQNPVTDDGRRRRVMHRPGGKDLPAVVQCQPVALDLDDPGRAACRRHRRELGRKMLVEADRPQGRVIEFDHDDVMVPIW